MFWWLSQIRQIRCNKPHLEACKVSDSCRGSNQCRLHLDSPCRKNKLGAYCLGAPCQCIIEYEDALMFVFR